MYRIAITYWSKVEEITLVRRLPNRNKLAALLADEDVVTVSIETL